MAKEPAPIRYKNPGAMWGGPHAKKWGAINGGKGVPLADGTGQNNTIAQFPTHVDGIAAQIALWRTPRYRNKPFKEAIIPWSGGNNVPSYIKMVAKRVPGFTGDTIIDDAFLRGPNGIPFLKAQAYHEAGREYPAPDRDWIEARRRVFGGELPAPVIDEPKPKKTKITEGAVVGGGLSITGIGATIWENVQYAPESLLQAVIGAASRPTFWIILGTLIACGYILYRRRKMKKA